MSPPGVHFLAEVFRYYIVPPLVVYGLLRFADRTFTLDLPVYAFAGAWVFTLPVYSKLQAIYTNFIHTREARSLGAEVIPQVQGKWPGNIDILLSLASKKEPYIGDGFSKRIAGLGSTFAITTLGDMRAITINPENIKLMLATDFDNYVKGRQFNATMQSVLGVGVFNSDGDMWQFHRKITRPFFARERVTDFTTFDNKSTLAIRKMQDRFAEGYALDFQDICSRFTLDSACEFLLGTPIHSLDDPLPLPGQDDSHLRTSSGRFAKAFANAQVTISKRGRLGMFWRLREFFKDSTVDDMIVIKAFIEPIVKAAIEKKEATEGKMEEVTLLDHLVNETDDMKIIVDEVLNIMLAGRDTTASLLTFVTYCLAMHPEALARLREEIISTIGKERAPTLDDLRGMKYLRAVLNETLRLFPCVRFFSLVSSAHVLIQN
ncbi:hypothetical protein M422DRAFT_181873 [Sphaerobolus stellatus SS14]|uniref:Cytochrome P450 n=1 Tax=Sphaerobolus stellatus (strain SS14) TaxID=990650 RepID=A0A0C9VAY5_SPHS4|nr:hypothetical protein M422DRAFT_181873 [Sphaerobolus stellatus SS14]